MTAEARDIAVPTTLGTLNVQDDGPSEGPVALLWPSLFTDGPTSWGPQTSELHSLGWRTLLVDPPGAGLSASASQLFTMEDCARAVLDILDVAEVDRAALLGLSWGGFVALRVALMAPDRVSGLVLSNTSARRMPAAMRVRDLVASQLLRFRLVANPGKPVVFGMLSANSRRNNPRLVAELATRVNALDARGLAIAMRSVLVARTSVVADLPKIKAPTLVIAGSQDTALPHTHSAELAEGIGGARLEVIPRVGHLAPREAPKTVALLLREFLRTLKAGS